LEMGVLLFAQTCLDHDRSFYFMLHAIVVMTDSCATMLGSLVEMELH
jgi:hypothetical protein